MKQIILIALLGSLTLACSQKKKALKWPQQEIKAFRESCFENAKNGIGEEGALKYCECMLEKIMKKYPDVYDAEKITMGETMELAKDCTNINVVIDSLKKQVDTPQKGFDGKELR
jgi:hypothetical protein